MPFKNPHPLYYVWAKIRYRAKKSGAYVCPEWEKFSEFLNDVGERPKDGMLLVLKDDSLGYVSGNCIWVEQKDRRSIKAGFNPSTSHPLYSTWRSMISRCYDKNCKAFKDYGGRGIKICEPWRNSFHQFVRDMGERPINHSIDRKENNGNYEPSNCRWATKKEQQSNMRNNRFISFNGETKTLKAWADGLGIKSDTLLGRIIRGHSLEIALTVKKLPANTEGLKLGGTASGARQKSIVACPQGHTYTPANTAITKQGWRKCRTCHRLHQSAINKRNKKVL